MSPQKKIPWLEESAMIPSPLLIESTKADEIMPDVVRQVFQKGKSIEDQHIVYKKLQAGSHPDWIQLTSEHKMEDLRSALYELRHRPFIEKFRVFSVSEIDACDRHFQNALLKTLEEPEAHWILLLSCHSFSSVLPTIKSRCLRYRMPASDTESKLSPELEKAYDFIRDKDEFGLYSFVDKNFSKRQKMEADFDALSDWASQNKWPGHWRHIAPFVDEVFLQLNRNLNPKLIWQNLWEKSLDAEKRGFY